MPYDVTVEGRIVHISWTGVVAQADLDSLRREMPRIGRELGSAPDVIHTFDDTKGFSFTPGAAYDYSLQQRDVEIPNPIRVAIVATTRDGEALATVFKTLNCTPNMEMRVFGNEAVARRWLLRQ
jgi:hypothetical protein